MKTPSIGVIDLEAGNLGSLGRALQFLGLRHRLITRPSEIEEVGALILPGTGRFSEFMRRLDSGGFISALSDAALLRRKKILGICVGFQIFFETGYESDEESGCSGLGLLPGSVASFTSFDDYDTQSRNPHIGFNSEFCLKTGVKVGSYYFCHSYCKRLESTISFEGSNYIGVSNHANIPFVASVEVNNLTGFQFHPEKSQSDGLRRLLAWAEKI